MVTGDTRGGDSSTSSSTRVLYNRKKELQGLDDLCSQPPDFISVVLGPRSSGKTMLLREYMCAKGLSGSRCFIDAREVDISSPSGLARALLRSAIPKLAQQLLPDSPALQQVAEIFSMGMDELQEMLKVVDGSEFYLRGKAFVPVLKVLAGDTGEFSLPKVIEAYTAVLDAWYNAKAAGRLKDARPPVLVLDEANVLMTWGDQYKAERQTLLRFFVGITTARQRNHVILATSDYSLLTWLSKEIGPCYYQSFVVGDFPAEDARGFLNKCLQPRGKPGVADADWEAVNKVCGGNAGALVRAAGLYSCLGSWEAALSEVVKEVWRFIQSGCKPAADAAYTAADYATAVNAILNSPYNAVVDVDLVAVLGQQPLEAMVQANLLVLRPYSYWAADIDAAAFGPRQRSTVVTAPTPLHLYLMEEERSTLLAPLDTQQVPHMSNTYRSAYPSRPPHPTSAAVRAVADEIAAVQHNIEQVEEQLQQASNKAVGFMAAKSEGRQVQLAYWQRKEQALLEEKRQLCEEESLLHAKQLLLMKREE